MTRWRGWVLPIAAAALAELAVRVLDYRSDTLAMPSQVAAAGVEALAEGSLLHATVQTLAAGALGLIGGFGGGVLTGLVLGASAVASRFLSGSIEILRPIPSVSLIPLMMMIFGFGYRMESATVAFATYWPSLILTQSAVRNIDTRLIEVARVIGLGPLQTAWKILLPAIAPNLVTALRLAIGIALIVTVTVEIVANPQGLGYSLMAAQETFRPDLMLATLVWVGLLGWGLNYGLLALQARLFRHRADFAAQEST
ncbi:MAG: ABC transporter permease [Lautropia sp.]